MSDAAVAGTHERPSVALAVSNAMVKIYKEQFGRGPTKARTNFAGPDVLVCTLSFVSGMDTLRDVATEVFYLEPRAGDGHSSSA